MSRLLRRLSLAAAFVLGAYIFWDNWLTEVEVPASSFETEEAAALIQNPPGISPAVHVTVQVFNRANVELESVDVSTSLLDCPTEVSVHCELIGRQTTRIQLLAPPHVARRADTWVYFTNIPKPTGLVRATERVVSGMEDRG